MPKTPTASGYMKDTEETDVSETTTKDKPGTDTQTDDRSDAQKQAKEQALSPQDKHQNYLDDLERLHRESELDPGTGKTRLFG